MASSQSTQFFTDEASTQSTQPFSDVSQPEANLEQLLSNTSFATGVEAESNPPLDHVRIFARCRLGKHVVSMATYPDGTQARILGHDILAIPQSTRATACDVDIRTKPISLRLFFNPSADSLLAQNRSGNQPVFFYKPKDGRRLDLLPRRSGSLEVGSWLLFDSPPQDMASPDPDTELLELHVRPRSFCSPSAAPLQAPGPGSKHKCADSASSRKKRAGMSGRWHTQNLASTAPHALLGLNDGESISLTGPNPNDTYSIIRKSSITTTKSATLYTANHSLRRGQLIAIKVINNSYNVEHAARQWLAEVQAHEGIGRHDGIVRLYGSDARMLTLYMEYVDCASLEEHKSPSYMCEIPHAAFTIISDIASALAYIHDRNLVHNDLKPANILYHPNRGALLIDLGLASQSKDTTCSGGTPWYVPPEYLKARRRGPPGDVFALGVSMLWVLGKCELPERTKSHPEWQIAYVHGAEEHELGKQAVRRMDTWLAHVKKMRRTLSSSEPLESVVRGLLGDQQQKQQHRRSTANEVVEQLKSMSL